MNAQECLAVLDAEIASLPTMAAMSTYKCDPSEPIEKLTQARTFVASLIDEVDAVLKRIPQAVRVREGGAGENSAASLAASVNKLLAERDAALRRVAELERALDGVLESIKQLQEEGKMRRYEFPHAEAALRKEPT